MIVTSIKLFEIFYSFLQFYKKEKIIINMSSGGFIGLLRGV